MTYTLVIGASDNPGRYSNKAIRTLLHHGYAPLALGVRAGQVEGISIETDLTAFNSRKDIDTITLYINPQIQEMYYETIIGLRPRRVIFNPGTENADFEQRLIENGIEPIEACTLVLLSTGQY